MRCAVLFTYYCNAASCTHRVRLVHRINPTVRVYGLYSGVHARYTEFKSVQAELDADYVHPERDPDWLWRNYDKVICDWFRNCGKHLDWELLFVHSWDLLLLEPMSTFFDLMESGEILLPGLRRLEDMDEQVLDPNQPPLKPGRWVWATKPEFAQFVAYLNQHFARPVQIYCEVSPFAILNRSACTTYSAVADEIPGFNEYRFPTIAHLLGIQFSRIRLPDWFWKRYDPDRRPLSLESVLRRDSRLFHPVYDSVTWEDLGL